MNLSRTSTLQVKLIALNDGDTIRERTVRLSVDDPLTIGRASSNRGVAASNDNTKIENKVISKEHASLRTDSAGDHVYLKDLKSMHGTKVDGVEVPRGEEVAIKSGAHLQFGVNVVRGSETYRPAMYRVEYRTWHSLNTPSPSEHQPAVDYSDLKRGYTDDASTYTDDEDDDCRMVLAEHWTNVKDDGDGEERSSLFGGIHFEDDSSLSEGEPEEEMDYPEESEVEEAVDSDSDSGNSAYYGPLPRSMTPPGGPDKITEHPDKVPEVVKRFQNSISDLVDQPCVMDTTLEIEEFVEDYDADHHSEVGDQSLSEAPCDKHHASDAVLAVDSSVSAPNPNQEDFVEVHQKVDNLIADARAEVMKAQDSTGLRSTGLRPQKRTVEQAELDVIGTPMETETSDDKKVSTSPAESPRKRTTAQFLRSFARDSTIFAAGGLAMLVGLAKLPNSLAP
ncbi:uncharacterized protein IWZ02DRAFT_488873 [Phyllosticta citriasiana]|uniref:FHA domain-containing protein n=1 Tax=Phyllosticta citriasiana TaxID=595635 RepID=A0ABR1KLY8_9PEZI